MFRTCNSWRLEESATAPVEAATSKRTSGDGPHLGFEREAPQVLFGMV